MPRPHLISAGVCASLMLTCPAAMAFVSHDVQMAAPAAKAVGCPIDPKLPFGAAIEPWPGAKDKQVQIVATSSDVNDPVDLGVLCVGVVRSVGSGFAKVAGLAGRGPRPAAETGPVMNVYLAIDPTPFHYAPGQTAFAVRVTGEFNSDSTNVHYDRLYMYRIDGTRLEQIFSAKVGDGTIDKVAGAEDTTTRVIKFSPQMTRGVFDLLLSDKSHRKFRRYVWTGAQYAPG